MELHAINAINAFYNDAFNHLLAYTTALITIIGIIVPLVIARVHTKKLEADKLNLENIINEKIQNAVEEVKQKLKENLEETLPSRFHEHKIEIHKRIDKEVGQILKKTDLAEAKFLHAQAIEHAIQERFRPSVICSLLSIPLCFNGGDETRARNCVELFRSAAEKFKAEDYKNNNEMITTLFKALKNAKDTLNKNNINGRYSDCLSTLNNVEKTITTKTKDADI